ncbi:phosphodiesterase [Mycolicibacterium sp. 120266]|uniref:phosphodiesterase n=1 Tax=Mycolicibacterium sp. 120266 TaxID=3090601 RepID=UPI00299EC3D3|nr:phosphodiesterase [Mycolicibacterium sp. 120266]MDX1873619.1 phosphodiesterase [Mycolicibacterium sp. 120266]
MPVSDFAAAPFQAASALRHARIFHPVGVLAHATIARVAATGDGLPVADSDNVEARLSKGIGTPGPLPDVIGLALRLPPEPFAPTPWDILLASAGSGPLTRIAGLRPVTKWTGSTMTTLMPLRYQDQNWWVRARMSTHIDGFGVSTDAVRRQLRTGPLEFDIDQACGTAPFAPLARLTLRRVITPSHDVSFDPVLHTAPDVALAPGWLSGLRAQAYARSRRGRHAS